MALLLTPSVAPPMCVTNNIRFPPGLGYKGLWLSFFHSLALLFSLLVSHHQLWGSQCLYHEQFCGESLWPGTEPPPSCPVSTWKWMLWTSCSSCKTGNQNHLLSHPLSHMTDPQIPTYYMCGNRWLIRCFICLF